MISVSPNSECRVTKEKYIWTEYGSMFSTWRGVWHSLVLLVVLNFAIVHMKHEMTLKI